MKKLLQNQSRERQGEISMFAEILLWSLFPVVTTISLFTLAPLVSLAWSTLFAALFFAIITTAKRKWSEIKNREALRDIIMASILIGVFFYGFYFFGLKYTSPGNASLIALTEIFFTFLFFNVWKKNYISAKHITGALFMIVGAIIVLLPNIKTFHPGDLLVLAATMFAPVGNFLQQRARTKVGSETIMFVRSAIVSPIIFALAYFIGNTLSPGGSGRSWLFLVINGVLLLGLSKLLWIEAIHRISVTKAIALGSTSPLFTLLFSWGILKQAPTIFQLLSFFPLIVGVVLLTSAKKNAGAAITPSTS